MFAACAPEAPQPVARTPSASSGPRKVALEKLIDPRKMFSYRRLLRHVCWGLLTLQGRRATAEACLMPHDSDASVLVATSGPVTVGLHVWSKWERDGDAFFGPAATDAIVHGKDIWSGQQDLRLSPEHPAVISLRRPD